MLGRVDGCVNVRGKSRFTNEPYVTRDNLPLDTLLPSPLFLSQGERGMYSFSLWEKGGDGVALALGHPVG